MRLTLLYILLLFHCTIFSQIKFPEIDKSNGYENLQEHARVAYPINHQNRIWVKGSSKRPVVTIYDGTNTISKKQITLAPPFYTDVLNVESDDVQVQFCGTQNNCSEKITLHPGYFEKVNGDDFSILIYGCMEPFQVAYKEEKPISTIFEDENKSSLRIRNLFKSVATSETLNFRDSIRNDRAYIFDGLYVNKLIKGTPKMILTTGDQVYVDAGYGTKMKKGDIHPISAWETKRRPKPFNDTLVNYEKYLNTLYNASYSFSAIEEAHSWLPLLPAIDDHELRDGWGSQGDEYKDGVMNPVLAGHYTLGKQAFIEHQLLLSNYPEVDAQKQLNKNKPLHYSFNVNGKNGYVFDLRSARNINDNILLGEEQWAHFEKWLTSLKRNQEIILLTSVPLTLRPLKWIENIAKFFKPELRDDARDGWNSKNNQKDRDRLLQLLTKHRIENDIKPIFISGDIHKSALIEIWVDPNVTRNGKHDIAESMILGYEVVASGISHEFIKTGVAKSIFRLIESQRIGDGLIQYNYNNNKASIFPLVRKSIVAQNFAALEFSGTEKTKIHTFIYNHTSEALEQHYLELNFEKRMPNDEYFIYDDIANKATSKKTFIKPLPEKFRVILDEFKN